MPGLGKNALASFVPLYRDRGAPRLWVVLGVLFVTSCAPQATPIPAPTETVTVVPTSTPTSTQEPTATVRPPTAIPADLPFQPGRYTPGYDPSSYFMFREDGRWGHYAGGQVLVSGTYRVEGHTYYQLTHSGGCPPTSFTFTFDGRLLKFQLTDESRNAPCLERNDHYDNKIYILSD